MKISIFQCLVVSSWFSLGGALLLGSKQIHDPAAKDNRDCLAVNALPPAKWVTPEEFIKDPEKYMVIGKKPLPPQLRGLLWLTNLSNGPALMSFGGPIASTANDGCSSGKIGRDGDYCLREAGEGTFASASKDNLLYHFARLCDKHLIYKFNAQRTHAEMSVNTGACPQNRKVCERLTREGGLSGLDPEVMLDMTLVDCVAHKHNLYGNEYPNSFCWGRRNWVREYPEYLTYIMVQVVDEDGKPIEPAWSDFVAEQSNPAITGFPSGVILYHDVPSQ